MVHCFCFIFHGTYSRCTSYNRFTYSYTLFGHHFSEENIPQTGFKPGSALHQKSFMIYYLVASKCLKLTNLVALCCNSALWLDVVSRVTIFNQTEFFILALLCSNLFITFGLWIKLFLNVLILVTLFMVFECSSLFSSPSLAEGWQWRTIQIL